jgi:hypothetical protein
MYILYSLYILQMAVPELLDLTMLFAWPAAGLLPVRLLMIVLHFACTRCRPGPSYQPVIWRIIRHRSTSRYSLVFPLGFEASAETELLTQGHYDF